MTAKELVILFLLVKTTPQSLCATVDNHCAPLEEARIGSGKNKSELKQNQHLHSFHSATMLCRFLYYPEVPILGYLVPLIAVQMHKIAGTLILWRHFSVCALVCLSAPPHTVGHCVQPTTGVGTVRAHSQKHRRCTQP